MNVRFTYNKCKHTLAVFVFCFYLLLPSAVYPDSSGFDHICKHFKLLLDKASPTPLTDRQRLNHINQLLEKSLSKSDPARLALESVIYAVPEERYEIYRYTAMEITGEEWSCHDMKILLPLISE